MLLKDVSGCCEACLKMLLRGVSGWTEAFLGMLSAVGTLKAFSPGWLVMPWRCFFNCPQSRCSGSSSQCSMAPKPSVGRAFVCETSLTSNEHIQFIISNNKNFQVINLSQQFSIYNFEEYNGIPGTVGFLFLRETGAAGTTEISVALTSSCCLDISLVILLLACLGLLLYVMTGMS